MANRWTKLLSWLKGWRRTRLAPIHVVVYSRQGCHLCENALRLLETLRDEYPLEVREIDVDTDPDLVARYGEKVPVVAVEGRDRLWGAINPVLLRRVLEAEARRRPS